MERIPHVEDTLDNGLRVLVVPQRHLRRAHVALHVRVGSRYETAAQNGISHFLEHMLYRGTRSLDSAHAVNDAFERVGGYLYAATQADRGVFSCTSPPESMAEVVRLFSEVVQYPRFTSIEVEKGIVEEEILEDLDDEGRMVDADNLARKLVYPEHPLGFPITGSVDEVRSFDVPALRTHHQLHYVASNSVLVFTGNVEAAQALGWARTHLTTMPRGQRIVAVAPTHDQDKARFSFVENASSQTELRVSLRAIAEGAKERSALEMGLRVFDDGMSTRLYRRICDEQGLCYDTRAMFDGFEDDGLLDIAAGVQHDRTAKVTGEILGLLRHFADEGPAAEELDKARRRIAWDAEALLDAPEELAEHYANALLFDRFEPLEERVAQDLAVTGDQVRTLFQTLVRPERLLVLAVGLLPTREQTKLSKLVASFS